MNRSYQLILNSLARDLFNKEFSECTVEEKKLIVKVEIRNEQYNIDEEN